MLPLQEFNILLCYPSRLGLHSGCSSPIALVWISSSDAYAFMRICSLHCTALHADERKGLLPLQPRSVVRCAGHSAL